MIYIITYSDKFQFKKHWQCLIYPVLVLILWKKHCHYVFENSDNTMHSISINNFTNILSQKSFYDILLIGKNMILFYIHDKFCLVLIIILITLLLVYCFKKSEKCKFFFYLIFVLMIYFISLFFMYVFTMPYSGAISVDCIERYSATIEISVLLTVIYYLIFKIDICKYNVNVLISIAILLLLSNYNNFILNRSYSYYYQDLLQQLGEKYDIDDGSSFTIFARNTTERMYLYHMTQYYYMTNRINPLIVQAENDLVNIDSDYIINLDLDNSLINNWIDNNYRDYANSNLIVLSTNK